MTERERTDLEKEMAQLARTLRKKLKAINEEEIVEWLEQLDKLSAEGVMSKDELAWLDRIHTNIMRRILPSLDNLDQVRWTLDKERGGENDREAASS
jgi:hypothetical protein